MLLLATSRPGTGRESARLRPLATHQWAGLGAPAGGRRTPGRWLGPDGDGRRRSAAQRRGPGPGRRGDPSAPAAGREPRVAALILAAGTSSRMGGQNKLLRIVDGLPLVRHAVDAALASRCTQVLVVTGCEADSVESTLDLDRVSIVRNPDYARGMSTSLRCGLAALPADTAAVLVLLADMPRVAAAHIDRIVGVFDPARPAIVVPTCQGRRGNPVLWPRRFFAELRGNRRRHRGARPAGDPCRGGPPDPHRLGGDPGRCGHPGRPCGPVVPMTSDPVSPARAVSAVRRCRRDRSITSIAPPRARSTAPPSTRRSGTTRPPAPMSCAATTGSRRPRPRPTSRPASRPCGSSTPAPPTRSSSPRAPRRR